MNTTLETLARELATDYTDALDFSLFPKNDESVKMVIDGLLPLVDKEQIHSHKYIVIEDDKTLFTSDYWLFEDELNNKEKCLLLIYGYVQTKNALILRNKRLLLEQQQQQQQQVAFTITKADIQLFSFHSLDALASQLTHFNVPPVFDECEIDQGIVIGDYTIRREMENCIPCYEVLHNYSYSSGVNLKELLTSVLGRAPDKLVSATDMAHGCIIEYDNNPMITIKMRIAIV